MFSIDKILLRVTEKVLRVLLIIDNLDFFLQRDSVNCSEQLTNQTIISLPILKNLN